jgi:hypothetical protein
MAIHKSVKEAWETNARINPAHLTPEMVHDAHHRGQLILALKTNGYPLPGDKLLWLPWRNE